MPAMTAEPALAPLAQVCEAIAKARRLALTYAGHDRVVEVHVAGYTRQGEPLMRAWQVRGGSESGEPVGWKMFRMEDVAAVRLTSERSQAPRPDYAPNDPAIARIVCQV
jgi:hypothetical protein